MPILGDGQIFERYRIIRWLGSGYSGESYEAEDRMLLRKVTLKLIHPWATLPDSARRQFFREMQSLSALTHPYLDAVLDYGESDGRLYIARRYVNSGSLLGPNGRLWYHPPLAVADAFTYTSQLAQVLHYIHQHGHLHGSLTFTNVLVLRGPHGEGETDHAPFLLADIGLANFVRRFGQPQVATLPVSAAPEQLGKRVTPASDQFALAVLLYFWLAGRPPYLGTSEEVEKLKRSAQIPSLSTLHPELTREQDRIILRALAVYPEERHPSVLAFARALNETHPPATPAPAPPFTDLLPRLETPRPLLSLPQDEVLHAQTGEQTLLATALSRPDAQASPGVAPETDAALSNLDELFSVLPAAAAASRENGEVPVLPDPLPQTPRPQESVPRLIVCSPYTNSSYEFVLIDHEVHIGRAGSSDLHLEKDDLTSRHHALLKREGTRALLFDKRSYNGVFVNGQQIEAGPGYELADGDHISIGNYELIYRSVAGEHSL
ncbi:MAG TPA: FHA domain-containing serine/threonine-protein kinase [Ktedonobacteraceae bacterium]|jgi:serine/threonine protein kinase